VASKAPLGRIGNLIKCDFTHAVAARECVTGNPEVIHLDEKPAWTSASKVPGNFPLPGQRTGRFTDNPVLKAVAFCIGSLTLNWTVEHTLSESVMSFVYIRPKCFDSFQNLAGILGS
jgi:hypothetical protein